MGKSQKLDRKAAVGGRPSGIGVKGGQSGTGEVNPFEKRKVSTKQNVLGRIRKGERKSIALARSEAFQNRKKTLLVEHQMSNKSNIFVDRRFAEDEDIPEEDKILMRFQRERMAKAKRGSLFNVDDDEVEQLTHGGKALGELSKFDDIGGDISDSDEDNLGRETVRDYHFGGGFVPADRGGDEEGGDERRKTKKEIMEEIIAKSKMYKAEKRREKVERDEMLEQLNSDYNDISQILASNIRPTKAKGDDTPQKKGEERKDKGKEEKEEPLDDFDALARELATEMRAHATQRLKTPEEVAQEESDRLVKAEKQRLRRMQGLSFIPIYVCDYVSVCASVCVKRVCMREICLYA
jgi:nucleolar protein 14